MIDIEKLVKDLDATLFGSREMATRPYNAISINEKTDYDYLIAATEYNLNILKEAGYKIYYANANNIYVFDDITAFIAISPDLKYNFVAKRPVEVYKAFWKELPIEIYQTVVWKRSALYKGQEDTYASRKTIMTILNSLFNAYIDKHELLNRKFRLAETLLINAVRSEHQSGSKLEWTEYNKARQEFLSIIPYD